MFQYRRDVVIDMSQTERYELDMLGTGEGKYPIDMVQRAPSLASTIPQERHWDVGIFGLFPSKSPPGYPRRSLTQFWKMHSNGHNTQDAIGIFLEEIPGLQKRTEIRR
jgi:hypothetical protein